MHHGASMDSQGWFIGPNGEFFFWVPPYLRPCSLITDAMLWPWADVSHLIHGQEWQKIHGRACPPEARNDENASRAWYKHLPLRHVTADQASSHVDLFQPALQARLIIQVGFNETLLQQGILLEEIHLFLDRNLRLPENEICMVFAPIFAPFPGIVFTPEETFYLPVNPPSHGIPESRLESQNSPGTIAQGSGASGDPGKDSEDPKKERAKDDRRSYRQTPYERPDSRDGSNDDGEDDKCKKSEPKGKERQRRPRFINIPFNSTLSITLPEGNCDQFTTRARVDITVRVSFHPVRFVRSLIFYSPQVNEVPASDSEWRGPSFTVKTTGMDLASIQVNEPAYFLEVVQTRIKATSQGRLVIADRYPTSQPFEETELIKTSHASGHTVAGGLVLGMSPAVTVGASGTQTSGVDMTTSKWNVTPLPDENVPGALRVSAAWKYAHNDLSGPVEHCAFNPKFHPRAIFAFQTVKTEVEFEVTSFWLSNRNSRKSRDKRYPIRRLWTRGNNPIFFNFLYQIAVVVDLEKIPDVESRIMPGGKTDEVKMEDLDPSKSPVPLERTTETAEIGPADDIVLTDCTVVIKTAVEGRIKLKPEERKGLNISILA